MTERRSAWRKAADDLLLTEGPQDRQSLYVVMMPLVSPGRAHRMAASGRNAARIARQRKGFDVADESPSSRDNDAVVGRKAIAGRTLTTAVASGAWVRLPDGLFAHRDWRSDEVAEQSPAGTTFTIPTLGELRGLSRLLVATDWERAAIVAAHVEVDQKPGRKSASSSRYLTPAEFAEFGIKGLSSKDTVRRYVDAWASTGLPRPIPGEPATLPDKGFPNWDGTPKPKPTDVRRRESPKPKAKVDVSATATALDVVRMIDTRFGRPALVDAIASYYVKQAPTVIDELCARTGYTPVRQRQRRRHGIVVDARERFGT